MIKHKHHIIPRHVGGTDHPSNIIELTIEEHAEAHRILYEKYNRIEDKWAWLGLSGQVGKDEILKEIAKSKKGKKKPVGHGEKVSVFRKTFKYSEESKKKMSDAKKGKHDSSYYAELSKKRIGFSQTEYQKKKVRETMESAWVVTPPNGQPMNIVNLNKFCRENGLDQGNMVKVSKGLSKQHKGYTCYKID